MLVCQIYTSSPLLSLPHPPGPSSVSLALNISALGAFGKRLWVGTSGGTIISVPFVSGKQISLLLIVGKFIAALFSSEMAFPVSLQNFLKAWRLLPLLVSLCVLWSKPRSATMGTAMLSVSLSLSQVVCNKCLKPVSWFFRKGYPCAWQFGRIWQVSSPRCLQIFPAWEKQQRWRKEVGAVINKAFMSASWMGIFGSWNQV